MSRIDEARVSDAPHVKLEVYSPPDLARPTFKEATSHDFKPTKKGESFGPSWSTHWLRICITVPSHMVHKNHLELHWDANNEGLIWTEDGEPLQGLTGGGERIEWVLPDSFRDGKEHVIYIEMACNGMFGNAVGDSIQPPKPDRYFQLQVADIVAVDIEARQLYVDFWIIGGRSIDAVGRSRWSDDAQMPRESSPKIHGRSIRRYRSAMRLWTAFLPRTALMRL